MNKILALVKRALQTESRQIYGHVVRFLLGGFILWMLFFTQLQAGLRTAPGLTLFVTVMYCNYFAITIAGTAFFASAITEEKEERTLGLLRMAGVGATSLILGKWIPRLIAAFLLLSVQIPFTILAITLGGVRWEQVAAAYLALFAHLVLVGNLGLLASMLMATTTSACGLAFVVLIGIELGPWILALTLNGARGSAIGDALLSGAELVSNTSCFPRISTILSTGFNESMWSFQVFCNLGVSLVLFVVSWLLFDICTRNEKEPGGIGLFDRLRQVKGFTRRGRVWGSALIWKDFYFLGGGPTFLTLKFVLYLLAILGLSSATWSRARVDYEMMGFMMSWCSIFFIVIEVSIMTARLYRYELTQKTWSTLCMLPQSTAEIAYSKLIGGMAVTLPLIGCLCLGIALIGEETWEIFARLFDNSEAMVVVSYYVLQLLLVIHLSTYFSILAKWGVWPLSISLSSFLVFVANFMLMACFMWTLTGSGDDYLGIFVLGSLVTIGVLFVMHKLIGDELARQTAD